LFTAGKFQQKNGRFTLVVNNSLAYKTIGVHGENQLFKKGGAKFLQCGTRPAKKRRITGAIKVGSDCLFH